MPAHPEARRFAAVCLALLACLVWPRPIAAEPRQDVVRLSMPQAQALAQGALRGGQPKTALTLSTGLLKADPDNGHALFIQARALGQLQQFRTGQRAATRAFRAAKTDVQRFEAAKLAAELAYADARLTSSQLWLRRAVHYAPSDEVRREFVNVFRNVRYKNPLQFDLRLSVTPSNNVNNGANSPFNIINGSPLVGTLSPSARAISGLVAKTEANGSYRLLQRERHETYLTALVLSQEVSFNDPVAGISSDDLSSLRAQLGLSHLWAPGKTGYWRFEVNGGRTWYAQSPFYDFAGAGLTRVHKFGDKLSLSIGAHVEEQHDQTASGADATVWSGFAGLAYSIAGGGKLSAELLYSEIDSTGINRTSQQWSSVLSYTMGRDVGPARISFSLGRSTLDYDEYWVITPVVGGRLDASWFGSVTASFTDYSYMGFVPELSVTTERSRSNISRFDVEQTAISVGIRSEF